MKLLMFCLKQLDDLFVFLVLLVQPHMTEATIKHMKSGQLACILFKHVDCIYFPLQFFRNFLLPIMTGSQYPSVFLNGFLSCLA